MTDELLTRQRTITWDDPLSVLQVAKTMDGLSYLRAVQRGEMPEPPFARLLGMTLEHVEKDRVTFTVEPSEYLYNPLGTVHGGVLSTLLDSAMGCVVHANLSLGSSYTTMELKVNFLRPATVKAGKLSASGELISLGRRTALAEARILDAAGKLYAHATSTCLIMPV